MITKKLLTIFSAVFAFFLFSSAHASADVLSFTCEYNYSSEGQQVNTVLKAKTLSDPFGKKIVEMLEVKSKQLLFTFDILNAEEIDGSLAVTMQGNYEGILVPAKLLIPVTGQGKTIFEFYGEISEIQCSEIK